MRLVGMHYKVKWHFKGTEEVASAHLNKYIEVEEETTGEKSLELIMEAVRKEVERLYPQEKYNLEIKMKKLVIDNIPVDSYESLIEIGDQTLIKADTEMWGY